jgi:hypothetical protein
MMTDCIDIATTERIALCSMSAPSAREAAG